ncbi:MAG: sulfatase-like hydrolase/transferase, partial [Planctomycetota bacterium]|nr:sulfatase-like hydrolase/transferase [Planctomycetota bacterium]
LDNLTKEEILDLVAFLKSSVDGKVSREIPQVIVAKKKIGDRRGKQALKNSPLPRNVVQGSPVNAQPAVTFPKKRSARKSGNLPNVLFIISDDQTWTDYGFMGHKVIQTPNLDKLASESYTFTRGYVPTSLCRPSLMTMISGLYPRQHFVTGNDPGVPDDADRRQYRRKPEYQELRNALISKVDQVPTLPRLLSRKGYVSFQCGKWWEGNHKRGGFTQGMTHGDPARGGRHGDEGLKIGRNGLEPITEFLDQRKGKPFFIWYAPFLPHTPHNPPRRLLDKYRSQTKHIQMAKYYAMCEWFDETCGELLGELEKRKLSDNTIILYVTDNGWIQRTPDVKLPQGWGPSFAPKSKQSPFDGGVRTPVMVRWPGKIKPAMDNETLVSSIDMVPTVLQAVGLEVPGNLQGIDLLPHCTGKQKINRKTIYGEIYAHDIANLEDPAESLLYEWCIHGHEKLIKTYPGKLGPYKTIHSVVKPGKHRFNLKQDPHEENPILSTSVDLEKKLVEWRERFKN